MQELADSTNCSEQKSDEPQDGLEPDELGMSETRQITSGTNLA